MIALDALRRLTVCQPTHESRENDVGLRASVWLRLRAAAGGNWTPDGTLQLEGEANFSCLGAHEALPKATLYGVVFQKLNGPLLTSGHDPRSVLGEVEMLVLREMLIGEGQDRVLGERLIDRREVGRPARLARRSGPGKWWFRPGKRARALSGKKLRERINVCATIFRAIVSKLPSRSG
jgi:hypothetical protein